MRKQKQQQRTNPVGVFVQYLKEKGYTLVQHGVYGSPDRRTLVQLEYIKGKACLIHCADGNVYQYWYEECPLPQQTKDWWLRNHKPKPAPRRAKRAVSRRRSTTMAKAFKEAE